MKILTAFVAKIEDDKIVDDVECEVILISQYSYQNGTEGQSISEEFTVAYCLNIKTGEVSRVKLEDLIIKSYFDEKNKTINVIDGAKKRV